MRTKHTPGPWRCKNVHPPYGAWDVYAEGEYICTTSGNAEANARLIAAAPEMFEVIKTLHEWATAYPEAAQGEIIAKVKEVYAKVAGEKEDTP